MEPPELDMSKAYYRVEWQFLRDIMHRLGFDARWIELMMKYVTTVKYRFKVNGDVIETIVPQRGLR